MAFGLWKQQDLVLAIINELHNFLNEYFFINLDIYLPTFYKTVALELLCILRSLDWSKEKVAFWNKDNSKKEKYSMNHPTLFGMKIPKNYWLLLKEKAYLKQKLEEVLYFENTYLQCESRLKAENT